MEVMLKVNLVIEKLMLGIQRTFRKRKIIKYLNIFKVQRNVKDQFYFE